MTRILLRTVLLRKRRLAGYGELGLSAGRLRQPGTGYGLPATYPHFYFSRHDTMIAHLVYDAKLAVRQIERHGLCLTRFKMHPLEALQCAQRSARDTNVC